MVLAIADIGQDLQRISDRVWEWQGDRSSVHYKTVALRISHDSHGQSQTRGRDPRTHCWDLRGNVGLICMYVAMCCNCSEV